jgi:hypothetical protein
MPLLITTSANEERAGLLDYHEVHLDIRLKQIQITKKLLTE